MEGVIGALFAAALIISSLTGASILDSLFLIPIILIAIFLNPF